MRKDKKFLDLLGRSPPKESVFDVVTIASDVEQNEHSSDLTNTSDTISESSEFNLKITTSASHLQGPAELKMCDVCFGEFKTIYDLSCNHKFCSGCLRNFFLEAKNPTFILPVRCCNREVNMDYAALVLKPEEFQQIFRRISNASYRLFCPTPGCENPIHVNESFTSDPSSNITSPPPTLILHETPGILKCPMLERPKREKIPPDNKVAWMEAMYCMWDFCRAKGGL
ncbi:10203_t:CDS:2 [Acaulospora morrowiae]|uniref:10203_t:CDS:1 n=1 Tax=Acaulospora morrowiae TaxID=94023 RepID=A0A9N9D6G5_9GLOM|nr:10203_t:CDS:2 [Acaulospora morrowiae]